MKYIVYTLFIILFFLVLRFFFMFFVLQYKSIKLFWKERNNPKYEDLWGDNLLLFSPLFFPLKRMTIIVNNNDELKKNEKLLKFLKQTKIMKKESVLLLIISIITFCSVFIAKVNGATWVM